EGREVWIDFKVQDADGAVLFESGAIRDGKTEPGTRSYKAVLCDPENNVVDLEVWKADRLVADTRILPKGHTLEVGASVPLATPAAAPAATGSASEFRGSASESKGSASAPSRQE